MVNKGNNDNIKMHSRNVKKKKSVIEIMVSVISVGSRPMSNVCLHYVSACIQTCGSILCDPKILVPAACQCAPRQQILYTVNSNLLNNATHKVLKFVDHKYIYYLTSHTCFSPLGFHQVYHSDI